MSTRIYIYTLSEESSGDVRYVGQTAHPDARLISHYYGNEPAKKPANFRISPRVIEMMDEICQREGINGRAALVQKLIDDYATRTPC